MADNDWRQDWAVIWRSELRALVDDREVREAEEALGDAARRARAASAAWSAAAVVPSDAGRPAGSVARLEQRVDELERRLAGLGAAGS